MRTIYTDATGYEQQGDICLGCEESGHVLNKDGHCSWCEAEADNNIEPIEED